MTISIITACQFDSFLEQIIQPFVYTYIFGFTRESFTSDGNCHCVKQNKHPVNMTIFFRASFVICLVFIKNII